MRFIPGAVERDYNIRGRAVMVRTDWHAGRTPVAVHARGLDPSTGRRGVGHGFAVHANRARPEAQSIVVHHPDDGARIACLDLT